MSLPKNCDGLKSPPASRIASRDSFRLVEPPNRQFLRNQFVRFICEQADFR